MNTTRFLECLFEISSLSRMQRTGWVLAGVPNPESIADHCFETAIISFLLAKNLNDPNLDMGKMLVMALFHEIGEARLTDLPRRSKKYVKGFKNIAEREAAEDILSDVIGDKKELIALLDEYHNLASTEAKLVEAAEELQIIFKALVYAKEGTGDITEYRNDVSKYDAQGFDLANNVAQLIGQKLEQYLAGKEYWPLGYTTKDK